MGKMARYAQKVADALTKYPSIWRDDPDEDINPNNLLGLFFRAMWFHDPEFNKVTEYFEELGEFFHDEMNDKLYLALNYLVGVLFEQ